MSNNKIGLENINNQGFLMKIIEYIDDKHIIIEFNDEYKTIVKNNMYNFKKGKVKNPNYRLGKTNYNNDGCEMKIIQYNSNMDLLVEFKDEFNTRVHTCWRDFNNGRVRNPNYRLNVLKTNKQGYLMKCIQYNSYSDIIVEFQDEHKAVVHTSWSCFGKNSVRNPYEPTICNCGIIGNKYSSTDKNGQIAKEYQLWHAMLIRCFNNKFIIKNPTYKDVTCCEEWLLYENFYEWLHSQENFDKWIDSDKYSWALDKDIINKGNKIYSPENCCLVPHSINCLFTKSEKARGDLPIGVSKRNNRNGYYAINIYGKNNKHSKTTAYSYPTIEEAFQAYKESKEAYIKKIAQEEYDTGNITKCCYEAMMNYEVEITD